MILNIKAFPPVVERPGHVVDAGYNVITFRNVL